jgi:lysozyme
MRDEGVRFVAYLDTTGNWTIGCGHNLGQGTVPRMSLITHDEMTALLEYDIMLAEMRCETYFPKWSELNSVRRDALINMAFNLGNRIGAFTHMIDDINRATDTNSDHDWLLAGGEMRSSLWAKQVGDRAVRLQQMIETGARR